MKKTLIFMLAAAISTLIGCSKQEQEVQTYSFPEVSYWTGCKTVKGTATIDGVTYDCIDETGDGIIVLRVSSEKDASQKTVQIAYYDIFTDDVAWQEASMDFNGTEGTISVPGGFGMNTVNFTVKDGIMDCSYKDEAGKDGNVMMLQVAKSDKEFEEIYLATLWEGMSDVDFYGFELDETDGVSEPFEITDPETGEIISLEDAFAGFGTQEKTKALPIPFDPVMLLEGINDIGDQIEELAEMIEYYFTMVLVKLEIMDFKLDIINSKLDLLFDAVEAVFQQQQAIDIKNALNTHKEKITSFVNQNDLYLATVDTLLFKQYCLEKNGGEMILVGNPLFPKGEEQLLTGSQIEMLLCQQLDSWRNHSNQSYSKINDFIDWLQTHETVLATGFPQLYDRITYNAVPWEHQGYAARAYYRLIDLNVVMNTTHLAGLYQNKMMKHLENFDAYEFATLFPSHKTVDEYTAPGLLVEIQNERAALKGKYESFKKYYKKNTVEVHDNLAVCQINGANIKIEKKWYPSNSTYIDYEGHSWNQNGTKWRWQFPFVYGFEEPQVNYDVTRESLITFEEAVVISDYYKGRFDFANALANEAGLGGIAGWGTTGNNSQAILFGTGLRVGNSGNFKVLWADCFFSGDLGLKQGGEASRPEFKGNGSSHMGKIEMDNLNSLIVKGWQPNQINGVRFHYARKVK